VPTQRTTLQQIADEVGVCRMTVSRALRRQGCVTPELTERIHETAVRMGYVPDPRLTALMTYLRTSRDTPVRETLGIVHPLPPDGDPTIVQSPTEQRMLRGIEIRAGELGYDVDHFPWHTQKLRTVRLRGILAARGIRGVVVLATRVSDVDLTPLVSDTANVVVGRSNYATPLPLVCNDHYQAIRLALREVVARGYRRVGLYLSNRVDSIVSHAWHSIFVYHQFRLNVHAPELAKLPPRVDRDDYVQWLKTAKPDAVISNDPRLMHWAAEARSKKAKPVGFCQIDWNPDMLDSAGVDQNSENVGAAAVDVVTRQILQNEKGIPPFAKKILVPGSWREGPSLQERVANAPDYLDF
jgi:DNA-binding LacI/PurR family transcriptional regulator